MRRRGLVCSAEGEVVNWRAAGKSAVRSVMVVEVLEAVEDGVEGFDRTGQVVGGVELVSPRAVAALDGAVV